MISFYRSLKHSNSISWVHCLVNPKTLLISLYDIILGVLCAFTCLEIIETLFLVTCVPSPVWNEGLRTQLLGALRLFGITMYTRRFIFEAGWFFTSLRVVFIMRAIMAAISLIIKLYRVGCLDSASSASFLKSHTGAPHPR